MWYWYVAQPNELFIDCDNWEKSRNHIRRRLMGAIECGRISVDNVFLYPSKTNGHMHVIVVLNNEKQIIGPTERMVWEIMFHSDIYRGCCNIMRTVLHAHDCDFPCDILISPRILHRKPDSQCSCSSKHKYRIMENCPTAKELRGNFRIESFFGKPSDTECPWF